MESVSCSRGMDHRHQPGPGDSRLGSSGPSQCPVGRGAAGPAPPAPQPLRAGMWQCGAAEGARGSRGSVSAVGSGCGAQSCSGVTGGSGLGAEGPCAACLACPGEVGAQRSMEKDAEGMGIVLPAPAAALPGRRAARRDRGGCGRGALPRGCSSARAGALPLVLRVLRGAQMWCIARSRRCRAALQHLSSSSYLTCSKCCTRRNLDVIFLCLHVNVGRCCPD